MLDHTISTMNQGRREGGGGGGVGQGNYPGARAFRGPNKKI